MYKELVICIIVLITIFVFDYITQSYTDKAIQEISLKLYDFKNKVKENTDTEELKKEINEINQNWICYQNVLSFYLEHDELEKVETALVSGISFIESEEYIQGLSEIEKTIFILYHINTKYSFSMKNIF